MSTRCLSSTEKTYLEGLLTVRLAVSDPIPVVVVAGDLDMDTAPVLAECAGSLLDAQSPPVLVLDLAGLHFISAEGIRALLRVRDAAVVRQTHLMLRDPSPSVRWVLTVTGMLDGFDIKTSQDAG